MPPNLRRSIDRPLASGTTGSEPRAERNPPFGGARADVPSLTGSRVCRGTITVICGCMFSGKTTELLRRLAECPRGKALAFKHAIDTRYSASAIVSHAGKASPAIVVTDASAIERHVTDGIGLAAIDEAHFFDESLADVVARLAQRGMDVVLTALQPDSWGRLFPATQRLLEIADEPIVTTATCARCGASADHTQRLTPVIDGQMVVEPSNYEPRCRNCWRPPPEPPQ